MARVVKRKSHIHLKSKKRACSSASTSNTRAITSSSSKASCTRRSGET